MTFISSSGQVKPPSVLYAGITRKFQSLNAGVKSDILRALGVPANEDPVNDLVGPLEHRVIDIKSSNPEDKRCWFENGKDLGRFLDYAEDTLSAKCNDVIQLITDYHQAIGPFRLL